MDGNGPEFGVARREWLVPPLVECFCRATGRCQDMYIVASLTKCFCKPLCVPLRAADGGEVGVGDERDPHCGFLAVFQYDDEPRLGTKGRTVETKRALITGITGQDGSYLAEHLIDFGYEVHGTIRTTTQDLEDTRVGHLVTGDEPDVTLHITDLADSHSLGRLVEDIRPTEVYNLAAQSHVRASFDQPIHTGNVTGLGAVRLLEAIRTTDPSIRFYQASSSEMFGSTPPPQGENTPFHPRSPYAVAKVYAYWATVNHRESYGIHASNGILFNHESPRRGKEFVTRKITAAIPRLISGEQTKLYLGNLDARRDWGHARDYVKAMHMMVNHDEPMDLVVGTGVAHSVRDFLDAAFDVVDLDWQDYVEIDPKFYRPAEVDYLQADITKLREIIGWEPEISFEELVHEMVEADMALYDLRR
jgi:GDPmannose 4,6-dehydratase